MDIVVDTSAIISVVIHESHRQTIIQATAGADLVTSLSVHWEIGNALSAMLRRERLALEQALSALSAYSQIPIRLVKVELDSSLALAAELDIYAYDAYLIRCAQKYRAPLLTLDQGLVHAARQVDVDIVEVT